MASADSMKQKLIQQQLVLLLHAQKCQLREETGQMPECTLPHCRTMKNVLVHAKSCTAGRDCLFSHCVSSRQIIQHWKNCTRDDCNVCGPLKRKSDHRKNSPGLPTLSQPPDMSDLMTTSCPHAVSDTATVPTQSNVPLVPVSSAVSGSVTERQDARMTSYNPLGSLNPNMPSPSDRIDYTACPVTQVKEWHRSVAQDLRNHLVHKIVQAINPTSDSADLHNMVEYAKKLEAELCETANSREEYFHLIAERIYEIQKELEGKQQRIREQKASDSQATSLSEMQTAIRGITDDTSQQIGELKPCPREHYSQVQNKLSRLCDACQLKVARTTLGRQDVIQTLRKVGREVCSCLSDHIVTRSMRKEIDKAVTDDEVLDRIRDAFNKSQDPKKLTRVLEMLRRDEIGKSLHADKIEEAYHEEIDRHEPCEKCNTGEEEREPEGDDHKQIKLVS